MYRKLVITLLGCVALILSACTTPLANTPEPTSETKTTPAPIGTPMSEQEAVSLAEKTVDLMIAQDFATMYSSFDPAMKSALTEAQLQQAWQSLIKQAGPYQSKIGTQPPVHKDQYTIVLVTLQFEKAPLDIRVVVDSNTGQISGLQFVPNQTEAAKKYKPPTYADQSAFEERDVIIGTGQWQLPGTLTMPKGNGPFPAVVLVHGSGPNDRDETVGPNKPFKDLAWGIASQTVAVLRYDKRTKVYAEQMTSLPNGLTVKEETVDDAVAAVDLLRRTDGIDPRRIFVLGHSLGGYLAPRIAQADPNIAGLIIMAGPTRPIEDLFIEQTRYIVSLDGSLSAEEQTQIGQLEEQVNKIKALKPGDQLSAKDILLFAPPQYWLDLQSYKPVEAAGKLSLPIFILQGERDYQVTMQDFQGWQNALSSRSNITLKSYPDLNHLFISGDGKSTPEEYQTAGNVAQAVIDDIAFWISETH